MSTEQHQPVPGLPTGVGNKQVQQRFIQRHQEFLLGHPKLVELCEKIFNRTLVLPVDEYQALMAANLPKDDPAVIAWEDRFTASYLIFQLGIMAAEDFKTVLLLTGNGAGFASFVYLRSMYERLVHAMYLAIKPSEAASSPRVPQLTN